MTDHPDRPPLIAFMADVSARTQFILPNRAHIESLPFDGMVINIPASWSLMSPGAVLRERDLRVWLEPLADFNAGRENYLQTNVDRPGDLFDDAAWAQVVENWRLLARVAQETGFKGILFDNEEYAGHWQDHRPRDTDHTLEEARAMASQRGREIMAAIAGEMPDGAVAVAHGPYLSVPDTDAAPDATTLQAGSWRGQELRGPFFTGLLEGMGAGQRLIDAGELYALRSADDFAQSFHYRNDLLPDLIDWDVTAGALENWQAAVDAGHMIYTNEFPAGFDHTPRTIVTTLLHAFDHSEGAVFLYSEIDQLGWFSPETLPQAWLDAVTRAVELADNTAWGDRTANDVVGKSAAERMIGLRGNDTLRGQAGQDFLLGGQGRDTLQGGKGDDDIFGGSGHDRLDGGGGADRLRGGSGADTFVLNPHGGTDRIAGFDPLTDSIEAGAGTLRLTEGRDGAHLHLQDATLILVGVSVATLADLTIL